MSETISDVRASSLLRYLERAKWRHLGNLPGLASVWASPTDDSIQVAVPDSRSIADYEERVGDALRILGGYENRSTLNLLEDVLGKFSGLVSVRVLGTDTNDGRIPIRDGLIAVAKMKNLFTAAALAVTGSKRPVYGNKVPKLARSYVDSVLLGQTQVGSYVINAYAPSEWDSGTNGSQNFGRSVISSMTVAIGAVKEAIEANADDVDRFAELDQAVVSGASANLCDALLGFAGASGSRPFEVTVRACPSSLLAGSTHTFKFDAGVANRLRMASDYYKGDFTLPNIRLVGTVRELYRNSVQGPGQIVVMASIRGTERAVSIDLSHDDYRMAIMAHDKGELVECKGDVRIKAGRASLSRASQFSIIGSTDKLI